MRDGADGSEPSGRAVEYLVLVEQHCDGPRMPAWVRSMCGRPAQRSLVAERVNQLEALQPKHRKGGRPGRLPVAAGWDTSPQLMGGEESRVDQARRLLVLQPSEQPVERPDGRVPIRFGEGRCTDPLEPVHLQAAQRSGIP